MRFLLADKRAQRTVTILGIVLALLGDHLTNGPLSQFLGLSAPAAVADATLARASAGAVKAADAFVALAGNSAAFGQAPHRSDPAAAPLLDAVLDTDVLKAETTGPADAGALANWLAAVDRVSTVYLLAGTGARDVAGLAPQPGGTPHSIPDGNAVTYQVEYGSVVDAEIALTAAMTPDPARGGPFPTDAPAGLHTAPASVLLSTLQTISLSGIAPAWRSARLQALAAAAPAFARALAPDDCTSVHDAASDVAARLHDNGLTAQVAAFNAALAC